MGPENFHPQRVAKARVLANDSLNGNREILKLNPVQMNWQLAFESAINDFD